VEQFGAGLGGEFAAGGFVFSVCEHYMVVSRGNEMTAALRNTHLFHEGISEFL
jgi:hypothetical protein